MSLIEKALEKTRVQGGRPTALSLPAGAQAADAIASGAAIATAPQTRLEPLARGIPIRRLTIDMDRLRAMGMIPPADGQRRLATQVRVIKNKLLQAVRAENTARNRVVMVTSALSGDGKTFNSVSIALSLATEKDFHVLLVDGDVPKPNVGRLFGIQETEGLLDAARDPGIDPEQLIIGTDLPGLDLLSAGRGGADAAEIMSSARMREVIDQLAADPERILVLDSPPLMLTSESAVMSHHAGQILLVVREALTPQRAVLDSIAMLGERTGISLVLNGVAESKLEEFYYGYGQNYAYGEEAESAHG